MKTSRQYLVEINPAIFADGTLVNPSAIGQQSLNHTETIQLSAPSRYGAMLAAEMQTGRLAVQAQLVSPIAVCAVAQGNQVISTTRQALALA
jgi:hypothetical protein